jgi:hypothetical protein
MRAGGIGTIVTTSWWALTAIFVAAPACTSSSGVPQAAQGGSVAVEPPAADAATRSDAGPDAAIDATDLDGGPACALAPVDSGAPVPVHETAGVAPAAAGGVIAEGNYKLTAVDRFTGDGGVTGETGETLARRCVFTKSLYGCIEKEGMVTPNAAVIPGTIFAGAHAESAATITLTRACPAAPGWTSGYTAAPSELHLFHVLTGTTIRETMTKE